MTLLRKCIDVLSKPDVLEIHKTNLGTLPSILKTALLNVLCKRGLIKDPQTFSKLITPDLKSIDLSECEVTNELLCCLLCCFLLQKLDLSLNRRQNRHISSEVLKTLFKTLRHLRIVLIPNSFEVNDEVVNEICQNCKELRELHIPRCSITDQSLQMIGQSLNYLSVLNIAGTKVSDFGVTSLVNSPLAKTLVEISIDNTNTTILSTIEIINLVSNLRIFNCRSVSNIDHATWTSQQFMSNMKQIFWTV